MQYCVLRTAGFRRVPNSKYSMRLWIVWRKVLRWANKKIMFICMNHSHPVSIVLIIVSIILIIYPELLHGHWLIWGIVRGDIKTMFCIEARFWFDLWPEITHTQNCSGWSQTPGWIWQAAAVSFWGRDQSSCWEVCFATLRHAELSKTGCRFSVQQVIAILHE